jgi:hypothetical protein
VTAHATDLEEVIHRRPDEYLRDVPSLPVQGRMGKEELGSMNEGDDGIGGRSTVEASSLPG